MHENSLKPRFYFTLVVIATVILHLSMEMMSGGIKTHYPLQRADLPPLSNWWGLVILPTIAWFTYSFMEKDSSVDGVLGLKKIVIYRLLCALIFGATLSAAFELGLGDMPLYLLLCSMFAGIFYPIYRFECILGFVLGMMVTFGPVIPTVTGSIVAIISFVSFNIVRLLVRQFGKQKAET